MRRLLLIEDDKIVASIYRNLFTGQGYKIEVAVDGKEGLQKLVDFRPDIIILDLVLPVLDGISVLKRIRADERFAATPVIVFTNTYAYKKVEEAWAAGATKCLTKADCPPRVMIETVKGLLDQPEAPSVRQPRSTPTAITQPAPEPGPEEPEDTGMLEDLRRQFYHKLPDAIASIQSQLQYTVRAPNDVQRVQHLDAMYRRVHQLTSSAGLCGLAALGHFSEALESLLRSLADRPDTISSPALRTVASSADFLTMVLQHGDTPALNVFPNCQILVVDDDAVCRKTISFALQKARLKGLTVEDAGLACKLAEDNYFDLVLLDVDMPRMDGYQLCAKIRLIPGYEAVPVMYITGKTDLGSRATASRSGAQDFITKPFSFSELAVKVIIHLLTARLHSEPKADEASRRGATESLTTGNSPDRCTRAPEPPVLPGTEPERKNGAETRFQLRS